MEKRYSGILLHPVSFPSKYGIGDFGRHCYEFIDFLFRSGQSLWQVLPLNPCGYGNSPYSPYSSFAGNELLIDLDSLQEHGILSKRDLELHPYFDDCFVDYELVNEWKFPLLKKCAATFLEKASKEDMKKFDIFEAENSWWLEDFSCFTVFRDHFNKEAKEEGIDGDSAWYAYWPEGLKRKEKSELSKWKKKLEEKIKIAKVLQYFFFEQWSKVKEYANQRGIKIVGDIPIFVSHDSSDVWANQELFKLKSDASLISVAGVPPDYFSPTGQRWGNPIYDWAAMEKDDFAWWKDRFRLNMKLYDIVRIDHFRGFDAFWSIPAKEKTAVKGKWVKAPGKKLFTSLKKEFGELPVIAEDLGHITESVYALRDKFNFPGMKVLHFAFDFKENGMLNPDNAFLPHNYEENSVVYTGTHDNDTTFGWYHKLPDNYKDLVRTYMARNDHDIVWDFIRLAISSSARYCILPFQDILEHGSESRMNTPSTVGKNWGWRYKQNDLNDYRLSRLSEMTWLYNRFNSTLIESD
ncbi:MAG: 4-alpha-glucanotransferase [Spirochaetales bacterium]|nr:4-alpha-glucanotransferase [Spirochaetales bacterium]